MKKVFTVIAFLCVPFCILAQVCEQFTNFDAGSTYSAGTFIGENNIVWTYNNARGNQKVTQNGDKAISFNKAENASLYSDSIPYGIKSLSFLYEQTLSSNCDMLVFVNDLCVGQIRTDNEKGITKIFTCTILQEGNFVIKLQQATANSGQITIDDITITFAKIPFTYISHNFTDSSLIITYSLPLQNITIHTSNNYKTNTYIEDNKAITYFKTGLCGKLTFNISQCISIENDKLSDTVFSQFVYAKPQVNDIVITEIMADPSPTVGLPECEYIELYNRTDCPIQCRNLSLRVGNSTISLPDTIFEPHSFLCFIPSKYAIQFSNFQNIIEVSTFPSITNAGTSIMLFYQQNIISSVSFNTSWYNDTFKEDGGWSLEKIDIEIVSDTKDNWTAANNKLGGTPGFQNSIEHDNPDNIAPKIQNIEVKNDSIFCITFSENIEIEQFINKIHFVPELQITQWKQNSLCDYELQTKVPCDFSIPHTLILNDECSDFAGNQFLQSEYSFAKTDSITHRNCIIFNEILFNPVKNQSDFIELYNASSSFYDLSELFVSNGEKFIRVTDQFTLFPPHSYAVISAGIDYYTDLSNCSNAVFINTSLPTMPDDAGTIILVNKWKETIDSVSYNKSWHASYLSNSEGVSLEKFSTNLPSHIASSWGSAAESAGFSTPGCENSQQKEITQKSAISLRSDVITPNNDGENDQVILSFSNIEYEVYLNAKVFSANGRLIQTIANNELLGANSVIQWDCTDSQGKLVEAGIYIIHIELLKNGKKISSEKISCTILWE